MMQQGVPTNPPPSQTTTKPRQMPGGAGAPAGGVLPQMGPGGMGQPSPGAQQGAPLSTEPSTPVGSETQPPGAAPETGGDPTAPQGDQARISMIAYDVRSTNPAISQQQAERVAMQVLATMDRHGRGNWPGGSGLPYQSWTEVDDGGLLRRLDLRKKKQGPDRPTKPEGTGEERPPQGQDQPKPRTPDQPKQPKEQQDQPPLPDWYHDLEDTPQPDPVDLEDLNQPSRPSPPAQRSWQQKAKEVAGPVTKRLVTEYIKGRVGL